MEKKMNYHDFFLKDNKSGYKTKESWLGKNFPDLFEKIVLYTNHLSNITFKEKIWLFINQKSEIPICLTCGKKLKFGRSLSEGYGIFCSLDCANKNNIRIEQIKETNTLKYGGTTPMSNEVIKDRVRLTMLMKYGVDNAMKIESVKEKLKEKCLIKHGFEYPIQAKVNKQRFFDTIKHDGLSIKSPDNYEFFCNICNHKSILDNNLYHYRKANNQSYCLNCYPQNNNNLELDFSNFLSEYVVHHKDRTIIKPFEIDFMVDDKKIGFELNGLYWHSELFKDQNYHLNKTLLANDKNIQLIHIFEDEWKNKPEIVKSMVLSKLGIYSTKIFARKCTIKEITSVEYGNFIEKNHLQSRANSKIKIGLFYNGSLVSVLGLGSDRLIHNKNNIIGNYEIIRYATVLNTRVIGGFSKMLKYFIKTYNPINISTFADRRYSNGDVYLKNGFTFKRYTKPNYFYIENNKRYYRFNYAKHILVKEGFDKNLSEREIMHNRGIYRIYDSGNLYFEWNQ